jgi:hypothetical protein
MLLKNSMITVALVSFVATSTAMTGADRNAHSHKIQVVSQERSRPAQIFVPAILPAKVATKAIRMDAVKQSTQPSPTTTTTTIPVYIPNNLKCPEYYLLAKEVGWPEDQLERLDIVMWRESRCDSSVHNKKDPNSGSRGLIQINGYWCRKNSYNPHPAGYLGEKDIVSSCEDLFDPRVNLTAGLEIYNYGIERHKCGWGPWSTRSTKWCQSSSKNR